jgi:outer membrane receptor protein involved in Fe transport
MNQRMRKMLGRSLGLPAATLTVLATAMVPGVAAAQPKGGEISDIEVPTVVLDTAADQTGTGAGDDSELDLANIVQSAAKGVTTVQEAPAIVTVVTSDEIRERQFTQLDQLVDTVPGWYRTGLLHSQFNTPLVRGQVQAVQFLHDGVSLFDPYVNVATTSRVQPIETIKRVEMITGPGGVLWGSNSLLGILNVITKDAEDIDGVEVGGSLGDGNGDRKVARAYLMAGAPDLMGGKLKVFFHGSFDTYQGAAFSMPRLLFHNPLPQPNSANQYGPLTTTEEPQSMVTSLDGKITYGKFQLRLQFPFGAKYNPMGLSGNPVTNTLPEDAHCASAPDSSCVDPNKHARQMRADYWDRYAVGEYRTRFAKDKAGLTVKGYFVQFVRTFAPLQIIAPSPSIVGGLAFTVDNTSYRSGGAIDGDVELTSKLRVLYGGEAFSEWKNDNTTTSRQGTGTQSDFQSPDDLARLPILCPRQYNTATMKLEPLPGCPVTFAYPAKRTVIGAYVNPQYRPNKKLIFDAGVRLQAAPSAFGSLSYDLATTVAATAVWNFIPNWHIKLNYAQGFRPPVFNNTKSNGEGVQIGGNTDLAVEKSDATQAEINARIFKGDRRIRELSFRIDGSYTRLNNLIQVQSGSYKNSGDRAMTSVEFLGNLYIQGGHRFQLGYTWLVGETSDKGRLRSLPEHWFNIASVFNLVAGKLTATTNLKVAGAAEDPNRIVEYRGTSYDAMGNVVNAVAVAPTELTMDRLPAIAELSLGLTWTPLAKLAIRATCYNALSGHYYQPDAFYDYEPHLEYLPNPFEGFRAYVSGTYQY